MDRLRSILSLHKDYSHPPLGLAWRSSTLFICSTIGMAMSTDIFLYGLIVPILPFILRERVAAPQEQLQTLTSGLLAAYAGASVLCSPIAGYIADRTNTRQAPFLVGLTALLLATVLLYVGRSVPVLVVARILQGISAAVVWTIGLALCLDTVGPEHLGKTVGTIFSFISFASLMGPVLGGILYSKAGYGGVFGLGVAFLFVDFIMRLLLIEKRIAAKYHKYTPAPTEDGDPQNQDQQAHEDEADEDTPLLPEEKSKYEIQPSKSGILNKVPLLYCFKNPSLCAALLIAFVQATLLGVFDATVPTETKDLFGFDSLRAGILFIPLGIGDLMVGPPAGWAVDKYGTKPVGTIGFGFLVPILIALRAIDHDGKDQIILYCALLVLCGFGLAAIGAPSIVEAGAVVQKFHKANPGLFGENGPYAQLYGMNCMLFSAGLTLGPILAGTLRETIGYGNMNAIVAAICFATAIANFMFLGGTPRFIRRRRSTSVWHY